MSSVDAPAQDARDWSCEMSAVASRQDRDGFMRIYDHFMPRETGVRVEFSSAFASDVDFSHHKQIISRPLSLLALRSGGTTCAH